MFQKRIFTARGQCRKMLKNKFSFKSRASALSYQITVGYKASA